MNTGKKMCQSFERSVIRNERAPRTVQSSACELSQDTSPRYPPTHVAFFTISNRNKRNKLHNLFVSLR